MEKQIRNFMNVKLEALEKCHDGIGTLFHKQLFAGEEFASNLQFLNYSVLPPGKSIGIHTHGNNEEIYIILQGSGIMQLDGVDHEVGSGDIIVNKPYGTHGLINTGEISMNVLVFEVSIGVADN